MGIHAHVHAAAVAGQGVVNMTIEMIAAVIETIPLPQGIVRQHHGAVSLIQHEMLVDSAFMYAGKATLSEILHIVMVTSDDMDLAVELSTYLSIIAPIVPVEAKVT